MDATRLVVDYLNGAGLSADAYPEVPSDRPARLAVVEQTGGSMSERALQTLSVDVDCWDPTRRGAAELAEEVIAALASMPDAVPDVFGVSVMSTYINPDMDSGTPRYTVGADITYCD